MDIDALVTMVENKPSRYVLEQLNPEHGHLVRAKEHREFCEAFSIPGSQIRYFYEVKQGPTVKWVCDFPPSLDFFPTYFSKGQKQEGLDLQRRRKANCEPRLCMCLAVWRES